MNFALLLLLQLTGCANHINVARNQLDYSLSCYEALAAKFHEVECNKFVSDRYYDSIIIRCHKEKDRGKLWDNWIFRISPANLEIDPEVFAEVNSHTICIDKDLRIEAYYPDNYVFGKGSILNKKD
jgi:hypothetical protein